MSSAQSSRYAQVSVEVKQEAPAPPPDVAQEPSSHRPNRVAVLVCHGMGQQVQFETLDVVARQVQETARASGTLASSTSTIAVSLHPDDGRFVARAELRLKRRLPGPALVDVHFYEAYWAPLTEGRVTVVQTLTFLIEAGLRGVRFAFGDGVFDRWMFGGREEFEIPARRILQLGIGLWLILLIGAAILATGALPLIKLVDLFRSGTIDSQIAGLAAVAFSIGVLLLGGALIGMTVARVLGPGPDVDRPRAKLDVPVGSLAPPRWRRWMMAVALGVIVVGSVILTTWIGVLMYRGWLLPITQFPAAHPVGLAVAALLYLGLVLAFRRFVRQFLVEFVGDVAAYVSPYKVSVFEEIRHAIQDRGRRVARFIYAARDGESDRPLYDEVFVVGHSLGSVLAYDTLNDAINRDTHPGGWGSAVPAGGYGVVDRTRLLLTFGSPLDKTAFVFRTQKSDREIDVREALAGAQQPLIVDYDMRRAKWINLWSPSDWISGSLGYYDSPDPPPGKAVCNIRNPGSTFPPTAHTEYWTQPLVRGVLHKALTGVCPDDVPSPQREQVQAALTAAAPWAASTP